MAVRGALLPQLTWRLGDGSVCKALAQPWFPGAVADAEATINQRRLVIKDLMAADGNTWNADLLIELFCFQKCMYILENVQIPREGAGEDVLIFTNSTHGRFSVKQAYNKATGQDSVMVGDPVWSLIWKKGQHILPRIRVFLWKLMHGALSLAKILFTRTSRGDPTCAVCSQGEEDVLHIMFLCPFARACWLMGPLALRTENLPPNLGMIFNSLSSLTSDEDWTVMANSAWSIWRCRNEKVYGGQAPTFERFAKLLKVVSMETRVAHSAKGLNGRSRGVILNQVDISNAEYTCKVDGS